MIDNTLYRPKLEAGMNASNWSPCSVYTSSLIKQTADGILLEVEEIIGDGDYATKSDLELTASAITASVNELEKTVSGNTENIGKLQVTAREISAGVSALTETVSGNTERIGKLEITASGISQTVSAHTKSISGNTYNIGQLNVRAGLIEGRVTEIENGGVNPNLFPQNGWMDKNESFINPTDDGMYFASGSTITSPKIHLEAGLYTASNYNTSSKHFTLSGATGTIKPTVTSALTETYNSATRNYETYNVTTAGDYKFIYGTNGTDSTFYRPKLETGSGVTVYDAGYIQYSSLISQTSKEIELKVEEKVVDENGVIQKFKETGIDITSGKIELNADNTEVHGNLELHASNDSDALTLYDANNTERTTVTSHEIGALSNQSQNTSKAYNKLYTLSKGDSTSFDIDTIYYAANSVVTAGQDYGTRVLYAIFYYYNASLGINDYRIIPNPSQCQLKLEFVKTDDEKVRYTLPCTTRSYSSGVLDAVQTTTKTVTITQAGNYKVRYSVVFSDGTTKSPFDDSTKLSIQAYMSSESPSKTLLGADGMYMTNGAEKYMYYGNDGFAASYTQQMLNGIAYGRSSVGARNSGFNTTSGEPDNKYLYTGGITGPSHIAKFKNGGEQWTNSQTYVNTATHIKNSYYNSNYYTPYPSTDLIFVMDGGDDGKQMINLGDLEYDGHVVMIKSQHSPVHLYLGSNNYVLFVGPRGGKYRNYEINAYYLKLVYINSSGSGPDAWDNYNGMWLILDEQEN